MDRDIKRILKLASIPGFKISEKEQKKLDEWKKAQEPVRAPKKKRTYKKKEKAVEEDASVGAPEAQESTSNIEKVQNIITSEEKTNNKE